MKREIIVESEFERDGIKIKISEKKSVTSNSEEEVKRLKIEMILKNLEAISEAIG
jgi:hypothetical protein